MTRRLRRHSAWSHGHSGFYELFIGMAANAAEAGSSVADLIASLPIAEADLEPVRACERRGDDLLRELTRLTTARFLGPFDPDDIQRLGAALEDTVDSVYHVGQMILLTGLRTAPEELASLVTLLRDITATQARLIERLRDKSGRAELDEIDGLESQADAQLRHLLGRLYAGEFDDLEVLRMKEVAESTERAINLVEDVADIVESIFIRST